MASREVQREKVIQTLADHVLRNGLGKTSLKQLAAAAGTSDRMLLYYFSDKIDIMAMVLGRVAEQFSQALDQAMPPDRLPAEQLLMQVSTLVRSPAMRPTMRLWLDMVVAAARQEPPFPAIAAAVLQQLMGWIESRLEGKAGQQRSQTAALLLAIVDGIALFEMSGGADEADAVQAALGGLRFTWR